MVGSLGWSMDLEAIEVQPTRAQIETALARGKAAAVARVPPDRLYAWFGTPNELEPRGFLMTKIAGLAVMSAHFASRSETPGEAGMRQILDDRLLLVSVTIFGSHPNFAVDSYMVMVQGQEVIKPIKVRFDGRADRTSVWPEAPAYQAKVVASFPYDELDLHAKTRISVFPAAGGEVFFALDFARID